MHIAESDVPLRLQWELEASNSLFWQIAAATSKGQVAGLIRKLEPNKGETFADGRKAWKFLYDFFENEHAKRTRVNVHDADLCALEYTGKDGTTITGYIDKFKEIYSHLEELGEPLTANRKYKAIKDGIKDKSFSNFKVLARQNKYSYDEFDDMLRLEELERERKKGAIEATLC